MPNINKDQVSKNTLPLVKIIRDKNPSTPIVFVENIIFENAYLDKTVEDELKEKNIELMDQYKNMVHDGIPNLF